MVINYKTIKNTTKMKNKKAWVRITEASIAILIVFSALLIIMSKQPITTDLSEEIQQKQDKILNLLLSNPESRTQILNNNIPQVKEKISKLIQSNWEFEINICNTDQACPNPAPIFTYDSKEVYTIERLITATPSTYNFKKIRFFVWMKE